jgi:hypothetical protein
MGFATTTGAFAFRALASGKPGRGGRLRPRVVGTELDGFTPQRACATCKSIKSLPTRPQTRMTPQSNQLLTQAFGAFSASRWSETIELCREVLALESDNNLQAYNLWASAELHGNHYYQILERIHRYLRPATYVEIGIEEGLLLALAGGARHRDRWN